MSSVLVRELFILKENTQLLETISKKWPTTHSTAGEKKMEKKNHPHVKFDSIIKNPNILCVSLVLSYSDTAPLHGEKGCSAKSSKKNPPVKRKCCDQGWCSHLRVNSAIFTARNGTNKRFADNTGLVTELFQKHVPRWQHRANNSLLGHWTCPKHTSAQTKHSQKQDTYLFYIPLQ